MRRRFILSTLALATLLGVCVTAGPASAHHGGGHNLTVTGTVDIHDDEPWPKNAVICRQSLDGFASTGRVGGQVFTKDTENICDGEVRVEFECTGILQADGRFFNLKVAAFLYEGKTTFNSDLDGVLRHSFSGCVAPGGRLRATGGRVVNTNEGGDYADFNFDFVHQAT